MKTLGVASIGHALLVQLNDTNTGKQETAVLKFIKPRVKERADRDIKIISHIAFRFNVLNFFKGTIDDIKKELDFTIELKNLKKLMKSTTQRFLTTGWKWCGQLPSFL